MKNDNTKILIAAAAGATAGVVAGLLMAPGAGKDSREGLLKVANQVAEGFNGQLAAYMEKFNELASKLNTGGVQGSTPSANADSTAGTASGTTQA